jgi:serine/threonine protein kinase
VLVTRRNGPSCDQSQTLRLPSARPWSTLPGPCIHAQGVIHRDIKPANVLFDEHDRPLLADFGIALLVDVTRIALTGAVIGTTAYLAPERVRGELVGPPADVYSLGLVLLEALTGRREYPGTSVESACARLHRSARVPVNLPSRLTDILHRMTAIKPADRPNSVAAARALQAAATELHGGRTVEYTTVLTNLLINPRSGMAHRGGCNGSCSRAHSPASPSRPGYSA